MHGLQAMRRGVDSLSKRPGFEAAGGQAVYAIEVFEADVDVLQGDNRFEWMIPEHLDGAVLVQIEGYLTVASSSGNVQVQIANERKAGGTVDMLSTPVTIDANELDTTTAATPAVINTANDDVAHGDHLRVDVDMAGTGAKGLGLILTFLPNDAYVLAVQGQKGDPGGVTAWTGAWTTATAYTVGQAVSHNGTSYVATTNHTSGATSEPGVGANWEDFWQVLSEANVGSAIQVVVNGNGLVIDPGVKAYVEVPFDCTLDEAIMLADKLGSATVDVWRDSFANYPPTDADSITGASPLVISSALKVVDSTLSGWSTALSAGEILAFNVDSCSLITRLTISLKVLR